LVLDWRNHSEVIPFIVFRNIDFTGLLGFEAVGGS